MRSKGVPSLVFAPTALTDSGAVTANVDLAAGSNGQRAQYAEIYVNMSAEEGTDAGNLTLSLLHSDDTTATNFATITADRSEDNTSAGVVCYRVECRGKKRYLRLSATAASVTGSNITVSAMANLELHTEPTGHAQVTVVN